MTKTNLTAAISEYLREISKHLASGDATEHTYRPALKTLLETIHEDITATNEPKRVQCGAPDFIITRGQTPLGYIEAKEIGSNLGEIARGEQLTRYRDGLPNLILTDYLEFRLFHEGDFITSCSLARLGIDGRLKRERNADHAFEELLDHFVNATMPTVGTPRDLARRMAAAARIIRDVIGRAFECEITESDPLHVQLEAFRDVLLHDLKPDQFSDMYAQTIAYGLFAARCHHSADQGPFTRKSAAFELPETNPFLREMFKHIAGTDLDHRLVWAVDHLAELLSRADMVGILTDFGKRSRREDPVVHFYETFLTAYDPAMREMRGVYYTPEPVVSYIVDSIDHILKRDFGIVDGLASTEKVKLADGSETHRVLILDPAVGTGTFLFNVVDHIYRQIVESGQGGTWDSYVSQHLLPRLFGFELLIAPYTVAHMKLGLQLAETGYKFRSGERLRVILTNTLEEAIIKYHKFPFALLIAEEAGAAGEVKKKYPVMVILGNPPYSGHSANRGPWIRGLLRGHDRSGGFTKGNYFQVDGEPLGERNPKWLNDDYVKFIRFGQWRIEQTGYGILAFITNHSYLDNPTFRGMRQSLMDTFDDIYLLDLHGSAKKKETAPDGSKDENVFDIQQGVAICLMVKKPELEG